MFLKIDIWKDKWWRDELLYVVFLSLFVQTVSKEVWVTDIWNSSI